MKRPLLLFLLFPLAIIIFLSLHTRKELSNIAVLGEEVEASNVEENAPNKRTEASGFPLQFTEPVTGMEFVFVKGGCYEMGDTFGDGAANEKPVHVVCVDDFYLGKYEVTQGQWQKVMGNDSLRAKEGSNYPVHMVSWNEAQEFIDRLIYQTDRDYRLPTEAEWEYAARSGGKRERFSGTSSQAELGQYAWCTTTDYPSVGIHVVGQKHPNGLGLYDMSGNVAEWCSDFYDDTYYKRSPRHNPKGPGWGGFRVLRNAPCSFKFEWATRTTHRRFGGPDGAGYYDGFRLAISAR